MKKLSVKLRIGIFASLVCVFSLSSCSKNESKKDVSTSHSAQSKVDDDDDNKVEKKEAKESHGAEFDKDKGIRLSETVREQMSLKTVVVTKEAIKPGFECEAKIFRSSSEPVHSTSQVKRDYSYASGFMDTEKSSRLRRGLSIIADIGSGASSTLEGILSEIDRASQPLNGQVELIFEIHDPQKILSLNDSIKINIQGHDVELALVVPREAVFQSSQGVFIYRKEGEWLKRIPVELGTENDDVVQILKGLNEGDVIVDRPVKKLWLLELWYTKGGGSDTD